MSTTNRNAKTVMPAVGTAVMATICGAVVGGVVATAMGRNLHVYVRFIGVAVIAAIFAIGAWVYQTYIRPEASVVEEREAETTP